MSQAARVAWYAGQYVAAARVATRARGRIHVEAPLPGWPRLVQAIGELFAKDWANVEAGIYPAPRGLLSPAEALAQAGDFFRDLPRVDRRRAAEANSEVFTAGRRGRYPRYYLQNFHYQTDGYLSKESARRYDHQVEVLFTGTADAMRRQALAPLKAALAGRDIRRCKVLDVACGTGRFLGNLKDAFPRLPAWGLDLSGPYLAEARRHLARRGWVDFVEGNAEALPFADGTFDAVTCIYLFHELPQKARIRVARELARVTRPGGAVILVDSLQTGDVPEFDGLLEFFPAAFHEPYYRAYTRTDLADLFAPAGLVPANIDIAFLSKVMTFTAGA
jgi:ubiquinone/menaquinone biosynthesis C-methylase UbiE